MGSTHLLSRWCNLRQIRYIFVSNPVIVFHTWEEESFLEVWRLGLALEVWRGHCARGEATDIDHGVHPPTATDTNFWPLRASWVEGRPPLLSSARPRPAPAPCGRRPGREPTTMPTSTAVPSGTGAQPAWPAETAVPEGQAEQAVALSPGL